MIESKIWLQKSYHQRIGNKKLEKTKSNYEFSIEFNNRTSADLFDVQRPNLKGLVVSSWKRHQMDGRITEH